MSTANHEAMDNAVARVEELAALPTTRAIIVIAFHADGYRREAFGEVSPAEVIAALETFKASLVLKLLSKETTP